MTGFDLQGPDAGLRPLELQRRELRPEAPLPGAPDFGGLLADAIDRVDGLQRDVADKTQALASGEPVALHDIMVSMGKSEVAFNLMLEVRNKLVDAWEKLSRSVV